MTIGDMYGLIDQHNRTIRAGKTAVAAADEGVRAARSQRLPDVGAQVSASYIGNAVLTDRDFAHVHGLHSPHFGNQLVVDARQTVYAGGAIDAGIRLAQLGADQARAELALNLQNQRFIALGQYLGSADFSGW
ncbi:TolC family protein [Prevotella dentalis]|uniref:TolC family protein n=1 Tax=Prevotella dentalis TaxID=52227 RepID=UPI002658B49A|nr:TolC family protein [Prevotella dentalis]MCF2637914.1 TolC family protein [Prevotella dentalis]